MAFKVVVRKTVQLLHSTSRHRALSNSSVFAKGKFLLQLAVLQIPSYSTGPIGQRVSYRANPAQHRRDPLRLIPVNIALLGQALNFREKQAPSWSPRAAPTCLQPLEQKVP